MFIRRTCTYPLSLSAQEIKISPNSSDGTPIPLKRQINLFITCSEQPSVGLCFSNDSIFPAFLLSNCVRPQASWLHYLMLPIPEENLHLPARFLGVRPTLCALLPDL